jgi:hypothetical protein
MQTAVKFSVALGLLSISAGMIWYEIAIRRAGKKLFGAGTAEEFYWMAYLSLAVIGTTLLVSAIVR